MTDRNPNRTRTDDLRSAFTAFARLWLAVAVAYALILYLPRAGVDERLGNWMRVANAATLLLYLSIPWLRQCLGRLYLPLALAGTAIGVLLTETLLLETTGAGDGSAFGTVGSLSRLFVIWSVLVLMSAWIYRFRDVMLIVGLLGILSMLLIMSAFGIAPDPELSDFRHLVRLHLLLVSIFGLVGYVVTRLSLAEQVRRDALEAANNQLAHYAHDLEELTISRERNRMARELHDTLAHTLSGLSVQLEAARAFLDVDKSTARDLLDQSLVATRSGLQETRRSLQALRATPLDDMGLVSALQCLAVSATTQAHLAFDFTLPVPAPKLAPDIEQAIYRITQEAVNNVVKHATAQTVTITLKVDEGVVLTVADDGVGFSTDSIGEDKHYGLVGIRERAALVNGKISIESFPNKGTRITLMIEPS